MINWELRQWMVWNGERSLIESYGDAESAIGNRASVPPGRSLYSRFHNYICPSPRDRYSCESCVRVRVGSLIVFIDYRGQRRPEWNSYAHAEVGLGIYTNIFFGYVLCYNMFNFCALGFRCPAVSQEC